MPEETRVLLQYVLGHIETIEKRFLAITAAGDFIKNEENLTILDAIAIRLQAISENLKKINRISPELLKSNSDIQWDEVIRFRDLISHHYEMLNYEIVFDICKNHLPPLRQVVLSMVKKSR